VPNLSHSSPYDERLQDQAKISTTSRPKQHLLVELDMSTPDESNQTLA